MPLETHNGLPGQITAGDTVQWREGEPEDVSEVKTAVYHFRPMAEDGPGFKIEPGTAEAGGTGNYIYKIEEPDTAALKAGSYVADLVIHRDPSGRETLRDRYQVTIRANPAAEREPSFYEQMIPILEAFLLSDERMLLRHTIAGNETEPMDKSQAQALLQECRMQVDKERRARRVKAGKGSGMTMKTHF